MFPDIGVFHPQIVHFVIALLMVGVVFRLISLTGKAQFTGAAALTLILIGTGAAVLAVKSGEDAHGPAERVPGARDAVGEHEEWGERTRNLFLVVAALELLRWVYQIVDAGRSWLRPASSVWVGCSYCTKPRSTGAIWFTNMRVEWACVPAIPTI